MEENILNSLRIISDAYEGIQKSRVATSNRIKGMVRDHQLTEEQARSLHDKTDVRLKSLEDELSSEMAKLCKKVPVYDQFLHHVVGIGPTYTTKLLAFIGDIAQFPKISMLWKYSGMAPVQYCENCKKRYFETSQEKQTWIDRHYERTAKIIQEKSKNKAGIDKKLENWKEDLEKSVCSCNDPQPVTRAETPTRGICTIDYSPRMKKLLFIISQQFVRQGRYYRERYDEFKAMELAKNEGILSAGHIDARARRKVSKLFLSQLWVEWRTSEGLPVTRPYVEEYLGHKVEFTAPRGPDGKI